MYTCRVVDCWLFSSYCNRHFFIVDFLLISYSIGTSDCKPVILYISLAESFRRESENVNQIPRTTLALETVIVAATNTALQV